MRTTQLQRLMVVAVLFIGLTAWAQQPPIQFFRYPDQRGVNVFETPRSTDIVFEGLKVRVGGAFAQQLQLLSHETDCQEETLRSIPWHQDLIWQRRT